MGDRSEAVVLTYRTADGRAIRHEYEPVADGYEHTERVQMKGGAWRSVGSELVTSLSLETPE
jgi:hypothetical protein